MPCTVKSYFHSLSYQYPQQSSDVYVLPCYKWEDWKSERFSNLCRIAQQRKEIPIWSFLFVSFFYLFIYFFVLTLTWLAFCSSGIWGPSAIRRRTTLSCHQLTHPFPGSWLARAFMSVWQTTGEKAAPGTVQAEKLFGMRGLKLTFFEWSQHWEKQIKTRILLLWSVGISGHFSQHVTSFSFQISTLKIAQKTLWTVVSLKHNVDCMCVYHFEEMLCDTICAVSLLHWPDRC